MVTTEFRLSMSRINVRTGLVRIELVNYGEDPHDLKLRKIGTSKIYTIPETAPGQRTSRTFRLPVGSYKVWCGIADHRAMGMRAPLKVVRRLGPGEPEHADAPAGEVLGDAAVLRVHPQRSRIEASDLRPGGRPRMTAFTDDLPLLAAITQ